MPTCSFVGCRIFAIGAGYSLLRLKLDSVTQSNPGLVGIRLRGPEVFVRASF